MRNGSIQRNEMPKVLDSVQTKQRIAYIEHNLAYLDRLSTYRFSLFPFDDVRNARRSFEMRTRWLLTALLNLDTR